MIGNQFNRYFFETAGETIYNPRLSGIIVLFFQIADLIFQCFMRGITCPERSIIDWNNTVFYQRLHFSFLPGKNSKFSKVNRIILIFYVEFILHTARPNVFAVSLKLMDYEQKKPSSTHINTRQTTLWTNGAMDTMERTLLCLTQQRYQDPGVAHHSF